MEAYASVVMERDQLRARNAELEVLYNNAKTSAEFFRSSLEATNAINERLEKEVDRLRKALRKIDMLCSDRKKIVMIGIQAFGTVSQITKAALEASDG